MVISVRQVTLWSDWMPISTLNKDGMITEKRTRFVCTENPSSMSLTSPQLISDTVMYRVCRDRDGIDCQETGNKDDHDQQCFDNQSILF
jgi:hypothetical protein